MALLYDSPYSDNLLWPIFISNHVTLFFILSFSYNSYKSVIQYKTTCFCVMYIKMPVKL